MADEIQCLLVFLFFFYFSLVDPQNVVKEKCGMERLKQRHSFFFDSVRVDCTRVRVFSFIIIYLLFKERGKPDQPFSPYFYEIEMEYLHPQLLQQEYSIFQTSVLNDGGRHSHFIEIVSMFISNARVMCDICSKGKVF
jgi:hypothetical protein